MSMPSSSEEVATRHGSSPALSSSSTTIRSSRASEPWCARAISRGRRLGSAGELVEAQRQALGAAAVVDEDDRRAVLADQAQELGVDRRPDRAARRLAARERSSGSVRTAPWLGLDHRLDRHVDLQVERLAHAGVDDPARAPRADQEAPDLLERVLRRRQPDALRRRGRRPARGEPLERQRQVRAALGRGDRVDLVDDHRLDAGQDLARAAVSIRYSDSGVVMRMSGGLRRIAARSRCGVSPVRTPTVRSAPIPRSGARRLRSMS